ncbi:MAG: hypothetical protein DRR19_04125 [Candidatus Parabeggiatoa sp. nov. 1]|nr:MAG: hypothetical protein DRR19_04125 [Gammaproteobacteria bacterium]
MNINVPAHRKHIVFNFLVTWAFESGVTKMPIGFKVLILGLPAFGLATKIHHSLILCDADKSLYITRF